MIIKYIAGPLIGSAIGYFSTENEVRQFGHTLPSTPCAIPKG